jgi:hypothetical protein
MRGVDLNAARCFASFMSNALATKGAKEREARSTKALAMTAGEPCFSMRRKGRMR